MNFFLKDALVFTFYYIYSKTGGCSFFKMFQISTCTIVPVSQKRCLSFLNEVKRLKGREGLLQGLYTINDYFKQ